MTPHVMSCVNRACVDVTSLDRDETHDMDVTLDHDAGLLRLLITVSDTRAPGKSSASCHQLRRPTDHNAAVDRHNVRRLILTRPIADHRRTQDFVWGALFFPENVDDLF